MPIEGTSGTTPLHHTHAPEQTSTSEQKPAGPASRQHASNPQFSSIPTVGEVQDTAKSFFGKFASPKIVSHSQTPEMEALRQQPATSKNMEKLSSMEHAAANAPGTSTIGDRLAANAGFARNGAAHMAAANAALGRGGLKGLEEAGYLKDHMADQGSPFQ